MPNYVKKYVRKSQAERRIEILEATLELLGQYGLEGTTVSRIAAAVGLTPGALYRHFDSRATLIDEANKIAGERALGWVETSDEPDILRRLEELGDRHATWAKDNFATVVRPFFLELGSARQPGMPHHIRLERFRSFYALLDVVEEGKRQGTIRTDVSSEDIAWTMHMFAWVEDIAFLVGAESFIEDGTFSRNRRRMLETLRPDRPATDQN